MLAGYQPRGLLRPLERAGEDRIHLERGERLTQQARLLAAVDAQRRVRDVARRRPLKIDVLLGVPHQQHLRHLFRTDQERAVEHRR